jgi:hypothetical protein
MKKITFLTRHYPPNRNINGILVCELVDYLQSEHDIECQIVYIDGQAPGNSAYIEPKGTLFGLKPRSLKSNALTTFSDNYRLIKKVNQLESDLVVVTTSPPLLPLFTNWFLKKNTPWMLWSFDLFPEGFMASNKVSEDNGIYKLIKKWTYKKSPDYLLALGDEQANHLKKEYKKDIETLILPAGVKFNSLGSNRDPKNQPEWYNANQITIGYFGNIGDAHNEDFLINAIELSKEYGFQFVLACYGRHAEKVLGIAKQFEHVKIQENGLPEEHLPFIDVHLVSLRTKWTHVAVPSKAVTAISKARPILFCGNEKSDNWCMFQTAGWLIKENEDLLDQLHRAFQDFTKENIEDKSNEAQKIFVNLTRKVKDTYFKIANLTK